MVRTRLAIVFLLCLAAGVFLPVVKGYWLADDFAWVREFFHYPWSDAWRLFVGDWSRAAAQEYRPLWALSFMIDLSLWGPSPLALHLTNLAFHLIACALLYSLVKTLPDAGPLAAPLSMAFFLLAPIHTQPVAWVAARGHILATVFILGALILLRRFEQHGRRVTYLSSIACALAAFATLEIAVALAPLLLLCDLVNRPAPGRPSIRRTAILHAPFWILLGGYLAFRLIRFGMLGRPTTPTSLSTLIGKDLSAVAALWLDPASLSDLPRDAARLVLRGFFVLIVALLLTPLLAGPARGRWASIRALIFFGGIWPAVSAAVLFGAHRERHFYLASVGPAIASGLAGSRLLAGNRRAVRFGLPIVTLLLGISAVALSERVGAYSVNGRRSGELAQEVDRALAEALRRGDMVVILPEFPGSETVFWEYFYSPALNPPFRNAPLPPYVLPSFASCRCPPDQWLADHGATLARLRAGPSAEIRIVEWNTPQSRFVTRALTRAGFWKAGYAAPDGALVRPRRPGLPEPLVP